jgi:hypothetical protein
LNEPPPKPAAPASAPSSAPTPNSPLAGDGQAIPADDFPARVEAGPEAFGWLHHFVTALELAPAENKKKENKSTNKAKNLKTLGKKKNKDRQNIA